MTEINIKRRETTLRRTLGVPLAAFAIALTTHPSRVTDGFWRVDADGNWSTAANWLNDIIASDPCARLISPTR